MIATFAVVRSDTKGNIVEWDEGAEQFFGYAASEAIGNSLDLIVPSAFRERHWSGFHKAVESGICNLDRATINVPVQCKDGVVRPFPARFVFLQDARNTVVGAMIICAQRQGTEEPFGPVIPLDGDD